MRKVLASFIGIAMFLGAGAALGQEPSETLGATIIFRGGQWNEPSSWEPSLMPGIDDNVVIPRGLTATAPQTCEVATLAIEGTIIISTIQAKTFEVTGTGSMESLADMAIDCRGSAKNSGSIKPKGRFTLKAMGLENSGTVRTGGITDWKILGTLTNTGTVDSKGSILVQASRITNRGQLKTSGYPSNIVLWSLSDVENNGSMIGNSGLTSTAGSGENGGNIYIACSGFTGGGAVAPGNGGDGDPPGKKGSAVIGSTYTPPSFESQAPPQGVILDESFWKSQTAKANPRDGRQTGASASGGLTLYPPVNSRPFRHGGFSAVVNCGGGQIKGSLKWEGSGTVKVRGACSLPWARFSPSIMYLLPGESCQVTLETPIAPESVEEARITFESEDGKSYVSLKLTIFIIKCPIIKGKIGNARISVTDDAGKTSPFTLKAQPIVKDGILCVPVRDFIEINHGRVDWDNASRQAIITMPGRSCVLTLGSKSASTNGTTEDLTGKTFLIDGKLMAPADSLASMIGASLVFDGKTYIFKYPG